MFLIIFFKTLKGKNEIELIFKNYSKKLNLKEKRSVFLMMNWILLQLKY